MVPPKSRLRQPSLDPDGTPALEDTATLMSGPAKRSSRRLKATATAPAATSDSPANTKAQKPPSDVLVSQNGHSIRQYFQIAQAAVDVQLFAAGYGEKGKKQQDMVKKLNEAGIKGKFDTFSKRIDEMIRYHQDPDSAPAFSKQLSKCPTYRDTFGAPLDALATMKDKYEQMDQDKKDKTAKKDNDDRVGGAAIRNSSLKNRRKGQRTSPPVVSSSTSTSASTSSATACSATTDSISSALDSHNSTLATASQSIMDLDDEPSTPATAPSRTFYDLTNSSPIRPAASPLKETTVKKEEHPDEIEIFVPSIPRSPRSLKSMAEKKAIKKEDKGKGKARATSPLDGDEDEDDGEPKRNTKRRRVDHFADFMELDSKRWEEQKALEEQRQSELLQEVRTGNEIMKAGIENAARIQNGFLGILQTIADKF